MTSDNPKPDTSKANVAIERAERAIYAELFRELKSVMILGDDRLSAPQIERIAYVCADSALRTLANALDAQPAVTWEERAERAGLRMMPTAWPAMTPKERQVYIDRWEPIAKAFFPELAPKEPTP